MTDVRKPLDSFVTACSCASVIGASLAVVGAALLGTSSDEHFVLAFAFVAGGVWLSVMALWIRRKAKRAIVKLRASEIVTRGVDGGLEKQ